MTPTALSSPEVWTRLIRGASLDDLQLPKRNGRLDLSGLEVPSSAVLREFRVEDTPVVERATLDVRGVEWRGLDFGGAKLSTLRLHGCRVVDCSFDNCQAQEWRAWATTFSDCSFRGADLRNAMLGGVESGERCLYSAVDFSGADLRKTIYKAAGFERCVFRNTALAQVDFQTSTFVECVFEGNLREVTFYARGYEGEAFPENKMIDVDFSRAELHYVAFRGLTLDRVKLPEDRNHVVLRNVADTLDRLTAALQAKGDPTAMKLAAFLNIGRKWVPANQAQKVINIKDLVETVGEEGRDMLLGLLGKSAVST
jgi:uncharacterized protein YjbI with pentapeptide repeats